mmetsp:Transcript_3009/g.6990  ORF Transcript_3009/g.6990 Transcript_3009/m.6990 type:complete len:216 (-) Transcript_3009:4-651(-)
MATWDSVSTAWPAGSKIAVMPAGMSSHPVMVSTRATIGPSPGASSFGSACSALSVPTAGKEATSCQGPSPAHLRSCGINTLRIWARTRSVRQRAFSSPKVSRCFGSGQKAAPGLAPSSRSRSAQLCSTRITVSAVSVHVSAMRSQAAWSILHQSGHHFWRPPASPLPRRSRSSKPCCKEGSWREIIRSSIIRQIRFKSSSRPMEDGSARSARLLS